MSDMTMTPMAESAAAREDGPGIRAIREERRRQVEKEGWTAEHDAQHQGGEIAMAAACYAAPEPIYVHREAESAYFSGNDGGRGDRRLLGAGYFDAWPWDAEWDKRAKHDRLRRLAIAGALIAAEIDRLSPEGAAALAAFRGDGLDSPSPERPDLEQIAEKIRDLFLHPTSMPGTSQCRGLYWNTEGAKQDVLSVLRSSPPPSPERRQQGDKDAVKNFETHAMLSKAGAPAGCSLKQKAWWTVCELRLARERAAALASERDAAREGEAAARKEADELRQRVEEAEKARDKAQMRAESLRGTFASLSALRSGRSLPPLPEGHDWGMVRVRCEEALSSRYISADGWKAMAALRALIDWKDAVLSASPASLPTGGEPAREDGGCGTFQAFVGQS